MFVSEGDMATVRVIVFDDSSCEIVGVSDVESPLSVVRQIKRVNWNPDQRRIRVFDPPVNPDASGLYRSSRFSRIQRADRMPFICFSRRMADERSGSLSLHDALPISCL